MSEPTLTEEDREALGDWWDSDWPDTAAGAMGTLYEAVERIVARERADALREAAEAWPGLRTEGDVYTWLMRLAAAVAQGREDAR